ncbi:MAG TPA: cytochrome ubiquinol oxidase subunit I [Syntrophales bacterium]|nr:cytochrome ubiquinol oxidase subunit I [Syntrophales bacterium]
MNGTLDTVMLSRLQFAFTIMFHMLWPVVTVGLSLFLVALEGLWIRTGERDYYVHARFWSRLFVLFTALGVVTGIPMEFQFGTNWSVFSVAGGDFFGNMLGFEGAMAFMLEATFLGIMLFGWDRVPKKVHLLATCMVALGASLSAFWILVANSWMQVPAGGHFEGGRFVVTSHLEAIFNPDMPWSVTHMWFACLEITAFTVGAVSAWYICRKRHVAFFLTSFKLALLAALVTAPLQIFIGDGLGRSIAEIQPVKLAAMEAHWKTNPPGEGAPFLVAAWPDAAARENRWEVSVPVLLSILTTHTFTGEVKGLRDFPPEDYPPIAVNFYAFRVMVALGTALLLLALWTTWMWRKGRLSVEGAPGEKRLMLLWMWAWPASLLTMEAGWIVREVGRQPWVIYGVLRTQDSASLVPVEAVWSSFAAFVVIYTLLLAVFFVVGRMLIFRGPDLEGASARESSHPIR